MSFASAPLWICDHHLIRRHTVHCEAQNKSPKEFVREIESYLKENQNHEGPTPAAPTLSLSSRLELNTRQKRIYGFV